MKIIRLLIPIILASFVLSISAAPRKKAKRKRTNTHRTVKRVQRPKLTIHDNPFLQCEDSCSHVHGIDLSHYQGEVFWETVGENTSMAYVYLKCTEGIDNVDQNHSIIRFNSFDTLVISLLNDIYISKKKIIQYIKATTIFLIVAFIIFFALIFKLCISF